MPDGSSSAAPVTNPGPSSRNKIFGRLAGDFLISFLEEFMATVQIKPCKFQDFFMLRSRLFLSRWTSSCKTGRSDAANPSPQSPLACDAPTRDLNWFHFSRADTAQEPPQEIGSSDYALLRS